MLFPAESSSDKPVTRRRNDGLGCEGKEQQTGITCRFRRAECASECRFTQAISAGPPQH